MECSDTEKQLDDNEQVTVHDHAYSCEVVTTTSSEAEGCSKLITGDSKPSEAIPSTSNDATTTVKLAKKQNATSKVWLYFGYTADKNGNAIDNGKPKCRTCLKEVSCKTGNTTNLFKHLRDKHPMEYGQLQVNGLKHVHNFCYSKPYTSSSKSYRL